MIRASGRAKGGSFRGRELIPHGSASVAQTVLFMARTGDEPSAGREAQPAARPAHDRVIVARPSAPRPWEAGALRDAAEPAHRHRRFPGGEVR
ncbi:hypothetical protein [Streptomyces sp. NPDC054940]